MAGSCVQVQCTFGDFSKDFTAFTELVEHALWFQSACFDKTLINCKSSKSCTLHLV